MTTLELTKQKILDKLPTELKGLMEMWMDFYGECLTEKMVDEMLDDCTEMYQHGHRKIFVNDLRVWALTKNKQLNSPK